MTRAVLGRILYWYITV